MNKLELFYDNAKGSVSPFHKEYVDYFCELNKAIDPKEVEGLVNLLLQARERGSTIFIIGNGGSMSTASHFAEDMMLCAGGNEAKPFRAVSLDSTPFITALGNDQSYEDVFSSQLKNLYREGDVLVIITASGNSPNVLKAIQYVNSKGGQTFGLLGFDGGKAKEICTQSITVFSEKGHYGPVESVHLLLMHVVSNYLFFHLNKEKI